MVLPRVSLRLQPGTEPLLSRAPTTEEFGKALGDMMMILPGFREQPQLQIDRTVVMLGEIVKGFPHEEIFAEFNVERNLFWI